MTNTTQYKELLRITENILLVLERKDSKELLPLLKERRCIFEKIQNAGDAATAETASWIWRIRGCEDRCTAIAMEGKGRIQEELQANWKRVRLGNRYRRAAQ